jgi:hypothetical protein
LRDLGLFLGFANLNRRLVNIFSNISHPLIKSTINNQNGNILVIEMNKTLYELKQRLLNHESKSPII